MEVYKLSFLCVTMASDAAASEPDRCWTAELPKQVEIGLCMGAGCDQHYFMRPQRSKQQVLAVPCVPKLEASERFEDCRKS